jgi:hypothetical protein
MRPAGIGESTTDWRTKATSVTVGYGGSSAGDNEGPKRESSRYGTCNPDNLTAGSRNRPNERLEPYAGKLALTVLRGAGAVRPLGLLGGRADAEHTPVSNGTLS